MDSGGQKIGAPTAKMATDLMMMMMMMMKAMINGVSVAPNNNK